MKIFFPRGRAARRMTAIVVAAGALAAFLPCLWNGFVNWDDPINFLQNPFYRGLARTNLAWMFTTLRLGHYIPVTWLTLGADYVVWGMNPFGYHLTNILFHAANAVLLLYVLQKLFFEPAD